MKTTATSWHSRRAIGGLISLGMLGIPACDEVGKLRKESEQWRKQSEEWQAKTTELVAQMSRTLVDITPGGTDAYLLNKLHDEGTPPAERERIERWYLSRAGLRPGEEYQISVELHNAAAPLGFDFVPAKSPSKEWVRSYFAQEKPRWTPAREHVYSTRVPSQVRENVQKRLEDAFNALQLKTDASYEIREGGGLTPPGPHLVKSNPKAMLNPKFVHQVPLLSSVSLEKGEIVRLLSDAVIEAYSPSLVAGTLNAVRKDWSPSRGEYVVIVMVPESSLATLPQETEFRVFAHKKGDHSNPDARLFERREAILRKEQFSEVEEYRGQRIAWTSTGLRNNTSEYDANVLSSISEMRKLLEELKRLTNHP